MLSPITPHAILRRSKKNNNRRGNPATAAAAAGEGSHARSCSVSDDGGPSVTSAYSTSGDNTSGSYEELLVELDQKYGDGDNSAAVGEEEAR
jgi:hypothetical protein